MKDRIIVWTAGLGLAALIAVSIAQDAMDINYQPPPPRTVPQTTQQTVTIQDGQTWIDGQPTEIADVSLGDRRADFHRAVCGDRTSCQIDTEVTDGKITGDNIRMVALKQCQPPAGCRQDIWLNKYHTKRTQDEARK